MGDVKGLYEFKDPEETWGRGRGREEGRGVDFKGLDCFDDVLEGDVRGDEEFKEAEKGIELLENCRGIFWMLGIFFDDKYWGTRESANDRNEEFFSISFSSSAILSLLVSLSFLITLFIPSFSFILFFDLSVSDICKMFLLLFFNVFIDDWDAATAEEIEVEKEEEIGFIEVDCVDGIFTLNGKCCELFLSSNLCIWSERVCFCDDSNLDFIDEFILWFCVCVRVGHMLSKVRANHLHKSLIIISINGVFFIRNWSVLRSSKWMALRIDCLHAMLIYC